MEKWRTKHVVYEDFRCKRLLSSVWNVLLRRIFEENFRRNLEAFASEVFICTTSFQYITDLLWLLVLCSTCTERLHREVEGKLVLKTFVFTHMVQTKEKRVWGQRWRSLCWWCIQWPPSAALQPETVKTAFPNSSVTSQMLRPMKETSQLRASSGGIFF